MYGQTKSCQPHFKLGVRQVVLTDITTFIMKTIIAYRWYKWKTPIQQRYQDTPYHKWIALIQEAFNNMMDDHKSEFQKIWKYTVTVIKAENFQLHSNNY